MKVLRLLPLVLVLAACRGAVAYTPLDLQQVSRAYHEIKPVYLQFKSAYERGDQAAMRREYDREQRICPLEDQVDKRDTIDPNINLFQVSIANDDMCNAIESAWAQWLHDHHLSRDQTVVPGKPPDVWAAADTDLLTSDERLRHPGDLA